MGLTYNSIKVKNRIDNVNTDVDILTSGKGRASFVSPYNNVTVNFTITNDSISTYMVRVQKGSSMPGLGEGTCPVTLSNIASGTTKDVSIPINATYFNGGDGDYTVALYAKMASNGQWDALFLFMVLSGGTAVQFNPSDASDGMYVTSDETA